MKKLALAVLFLSGAVAFAASPVTTNDNTEQLFGGPGHGGPGHGNPGQPGHGGPGHGGPPPPPQQPPGWGQDYGQGVTRRWADLGTFKAPKVIQGDATINTNNALVNEVVLRVSSAPVDIVSVYAYLYSGRVVEIRQLNGRYNPGNDLRVRLDFNYSLRVSRIVIRATSPQVIGGSGKIQTLLGLAQ